jgi:hypothetical protein
MIPAWDDGANFLGWFSDWMDSSLAARGERFQDVRERKRLRLGVSFP